MRLTISLPSTREDYDDLREILRHYAEMRGHDSALGAYEAELQDLEQKYSPPEGFILLARMEGIPAGCVAIQPLSDLDCEMKRMYVLPEFQGQGIGRKLAEGILEEAEKLGYKAMFLDTHPWMKTAHRLYQSLGFEETVRYNQNPTPGIRFFVRSLEA